MVVLPNLIGILRTSQLGHQRSGNFKCLYQRTIILKMQTSKKLRQMCLIGLKVLGYLAQYYCSGISGCSIIKALSGQDLTRSLISGIKGLRIGFLETCLGLLSHNGILGKVAPRYCGGIEGPQVYQHYTCLTF